MRTVNELKNIYEKRYENIETQVNLKEVRLYKKFRKLLLPGNFLIKDSSLLDLGCGKGNKITGFSENCKRVLAIDISENVIEVCKKKFPNSTIEFKAIDATNIEEKFNIVTAFGFSLFNTNDNELFLKTLKGFVDRNIDKNQTSFFIIRSHTDFSGNGQDSWYLHTKKDLAILKKEIEKNGKVEILFPHKKLSNYFSYGLYNFFAEVYRLLKKKKTFFIVIKYE